MKNFKVSQGVINEWNLLCKNNDNVTDETTKSKVLLAINNGKLVEDNIYGCFDLRFVVNNGVVESMFRITPRVIVSPDNWKFVSDRLKMNNNFEFLGFDDNGKCKIKYGM